MSSYLLRGFAVWLLIALVETIHGTLRTLFLKPIVGDLASRQIGVFTGSLMILLIAYATIEWIGAAKPKPLVAVGTLWLVLMLGFEVAIGRAFGATWERIASDYQLSQGGFMTIGLTTLALSPLIAYRLRANRRRRA